MEVDTLAAAERAEITGLSDIKRKMHFSGTVAKTTLAGAVIEIGVGTPGVVHISQLSAEPVNRVEDVVKVGEAVDVWVRRVDVAKGRIELTMVKPLELDWRDLKEEMVLKGKVTKLEKFGVFVDVGAERPGLVHISEMTHDYIKAPGDVVKEGDEVEVKVLAVNRRKKQIKLSMKALQEKPIKIAKEALKEPRKERASFVEPEAEKEEPVPTAMEMALREAMEKSKTKSIEPGRGKKKSASSNREIEGILSRTLENKVKSK